MERRGCALFPVKIFEGKSSQQNTKVYAEGWCEMVAREMHRRVRVQCCGVCRPCPCEGTGKSARASAAYGPEIN